jgi:hypothetical protein
MWSHGDTFKVVQQVSRVTEVYQLKLETLPACRARPAQPERDGQQKSQSGNAIEHGISGSSCPRRKEGLMPFVHRRHRGGGQPGQDRRTPIPSAGARQRRPPGSQQQQTQNPINNDVPRLAQIMMPYLKLVNINLPEYAGQEPEQEIAGVFRGEILRRLKPDETDPGGRRPPGAQKMGTLSLRFREFEFQGPASPYSTA